MDLSQLPDGVLMIFGGIPTAVVVYLAVQAMKVAGLVNDGDGARRANIIVALIFGGLWAAQQFYPALQPVFVILTTALTGSLLAGLGYVGIEKLIARWVTPK